MNTQTSFISDSTATKKVAHYWSQSAKAVHIMEAAYKAKQQPQVWGCEQPEVTPQCKALVPYEAPVKPSMLQGVVEWVKPLLMPALVTILLLTVRVVVASVIWLVTEPRAFLDRHHETILNAVGVTAYHLGKVAFYVYGSVRLVCFWIHCWIVLSRA
jgi:hypothetical protein